MSKTEGLGFIAQLLPCIDISCNKIIILFYFICLVSFGRNKQAMWIVSTKMIHGAACTSKPHALSARISSWSATSSASFNIQLQHVHSTILISPFPFYDSNTALHSNSQIPPPANACLCWKARCCIHDFRITSSAVQDVKQIWSSRFVWLIPIFNNTTKVLESP